MYTMPVRPGLKKAKGPTEVAAPLHIARLAATANFASHFSVKLVIGTAPKGKIEFCIHESEGSIINSIRVTLKVKVLYTNT